MDSVEKIGLIAGNGQFPLLVLDSARRQGVPLVVAAIKEETSPEIESYGFAVQWLSLGQLGKLVKYFKAAGVRKAIMAGQVKHVQIFGTSVPDLTMIRMLTGLREKNTNALIGGVAEVLKLEGITLVDSTLLLADQMAPAGLLTRRGLSDREEADVVYGRPIARRIAAMDLGQTIVVRSRAVVAIEAMEGTDAVIRRAGELVHRKELTVIKVSKPAQDMRFDVPVVGLPTIEAMVESGATALALDAHKTLVLGRSDFVAAANRHRLAVVGFAPDE